MEICQTDKETNNIHICKSAVCGVRLTRYCRKFVTFATGAEETVEHPTYSTARRAAPFTSKLDMVFLLQENEFSSKKQRVVLRTSLLVATGRPESIRPEDCRLSCVRPQQGPLVRQILSAQYNCRLPVGPLPQTPVRLRTECNGSPAQIPP